MNILFATIQSNPFDPTYGGAQRSRLLLDACASLGNVDIVMFNCDDNITSYIPNCNIVYSGHIPMIAKSMGRKEKLLSLFHYKNIYSYYCNNPEMEKVLDGIIAKGNYDYIVVRYLPEAIQMGLEKYGKRLIVDIDDHPHEAFMQQSKQCKSVFNRFYMYLHACLVPYAMRKLIRSIKGAFVPNEKYIDLPNIYYLPNVSYNTEEISLPASNSKTKKILFVGKLDYAPNHMGLSHFVKHIWPIVIESYNNAELEIVGKDAGTTDLTEHYNLWKNTPYVNVIGFVDDIHDMYKDCYMTVSPIYEGNGTNIKVLESAQMKRTCVTTVCGVRGLEKYFENHKDILVAENDNEYAEMIISLLRNPQMNNKIATNAYEKVNRYFSKKIFSQILQRAIEETR